MQEPLSAEKAPLGPSSVVTVGPQGSVTRSAFHRKEMTELGSHLLPSGRLCAP